MKLFNLTVFITVLVGLFYLSQGEILEPQSNKYQLDLCNLQENQRGKVTGRIIRVERTTQRLVTIGALDSTCTAQVVIKPDFPQSLQRTLSFTATVQGGYLKAPGNITWEDNLGTVIKYQEITTLINDKPREIGEKNLLAIDLWDTNGKRKSLYLPRNLAKQIDYGSVNTIYYDSNHTVKSISVSQKAKN